VVRPTSEKVREAIFDILRPVFPEWCFLDLFAGTGGMGIEALSRGMVRAVFVENDPHVVTVLKKNVSACKLEGRAEVISLPVQRALKRLKSRYEKFAVIFLDPPYQRNLVESTMQELSESRVLALGGVIIAEHASRESIKPVYGNLALDDRRQYGQTVISFFTYHDCKGGLYGKSCCLPGVV